jgi:hypothetical protein
MNGIMTGACPILCATYLKRLPVFVARHFIIWGMIDSFAASGFFGHPFPFI